MGTYRERRAAKAERLREWAQKREERGSARLAQVDAVSSAIPFGQPIMGPRDARRRERLRESTGRAFADLEKAEEMRQRAASIEAAADRAIYRDDPDAAERLAAKLAELEEKRERIKRYNASCRRGAPDLSLLDEGERADIARLQELAGWQCKGGAFPGYVLSNLGATIRKERERLAEVTR